MLLTFWALGPEPWALSHTGILKYQSASLPHPRTVLTANPR